MGVGDIVYNAAGAAGSTGTAPGFDLRISGNTSGTTALVSSGTLTLNGGNNITLSQNGNAITISGGYTATTLQQAFLGGSVQNQSFSWGNGTVQVYPFFTPDYITATRVHIPISVSVSTSSNSSHAGSLSFQFGIYTNNAGTLSSASSSSMSTAWTDTAGASTQSLQGNRFLTIPLNINMTPGQYYIAQQSSTNSANANWATLRNWGAGFGNFSAQFGTRYAGASTIGLALGFGRYSVQTAALPTSMSFQELQNVDQLGPTFWGATILNTTYP